MFFLLFSFASLRRILDAEMKSVHSTGLTNRKEEKEPVSLEEEEKMWQAGELGAKSARSLLNTLYFYNGKLFGIRSQEHRDLRLNYICLENGNTIVFRENCSKTFHGGISDMKKKGRVATHICHEVGKENHKRCLFDMYKRYFSLVSSLKSKNEAFYFQPFETKFAFKNMPIGKHSLDVILPNLCSAIGTKRKTSHCLRVTCVSNLFQASVEEKLIRGRSGHVSNALLGYEKTSQQQEIKVSNLLNPPACTEKVSGNRSEGITDEQHLEEDLVLPNFCIDEIDEFIRDYSLPEIESSNNVAANKNNNASSQGPITIKGHCTVTINNFNL